MAVIRGKGAVWGALFLALGSVFFFSGCSSTHCRVKEIEQLQEKKEQKPKTVLVYRYDGTLQCGMGKRISIEEMQKDLRDIPILSSRHLNDGMMRIQLCGSPTGDANVYEIDEGHLEKAKSLGFREWTFGGTPP